MNERAMVGASCCKVGSLGFEIVNGCWLKVELSNDLMNQNRSRASRVE